MITEPKQPHLFETHNFYRVLCANLLVLSSRLRRLASSASLRQWIDSLSAVADKIEFLRLGTQNQRPEHFEPWTSCHRRHEQSQLNALQPRTHLLSIVNPTRPPTQRSYSTARVPPVSVHTFSLARSPAQPPCGSKSPRSSPRWRTSFESPRARSPQSSCRRY